MFLFYLLVFCVVVQCLYALFFILGMAAMRKYPITEDAPLVSVIICAKDEAENLRQNLPTILQQQYNAPYEVIVVNDHSQDDTEVILQTLEQEYPHLRHINMPQDKHGKKYALIAGTESATNDLLLLTDADCTPASDTWLQHMTAPLANGKEIVAGLGKYTKNWGILQTFIAWETMHTFMQFAGYAGNGLPYMATGRNMACTRAAIEKAIQHPLWAQLSSGHDDLIVLASGTETNTMAVCNEESYTISAPKTSWKEWAAQKQRHVSTGKHYRPLIKFLLGLYAVTHAATWLLLFILLFTKNGPLAMMLLAVRLCFSLVALNTTARKSGKKLKGPIWLLADFGWMIYNFAFLPYIAWKNKTNWK